MLTGAQGRPRAALSSCSTRPTTGPPLGAPLSLLALAGTLREARFDVRLIDAAIDPNYLETIRQHAAEAVLIGISVLTGPMIRGAIEVARLVKAHAPQTPVVFGGWHPTLCPESTLREGLRRHRGPWPG